MDKNGSSKLSNPVIASLLAIFCTFLWGSAYPAVKLGYEYFNIGSDDSAYKIAFAGIRFLVSGLIVLFFYTITNRGEKSETLRTLNKEQWIKIAVLGLMQTTIHYYFYYIGLSYTSGAKASILNSLTVFFSALLSHFFYKDDKISSTKAFGIVIGLFAVTLVNWSPSLGLSFKIKGELFIMMASFFAATSALYSKRAANVVNPVLLAALQLSLGGSLLLIIGLVAGSPFPASNLTGWILFAYMALLSAVVFSLWASLLKHNKVSSITVFYFLIPVFGTILSALILKESVFQIQYLIALPAVAVGIYLVNR
jgi:drug/metabolite transporter (DMT)-like permease